MIAKPVVTFWRSYEDKAGRLVTPDSWEALFEQLESPVEFEGERKHPGWSAGSFVDNRRLKENAQQICAVVFDYDNKVNARVDGKIEPRKVDDPITLEACAEKWQSFFGQIHTSKSHVPEWPRLRVVLALSRRVSGFEYEALWARLSRVAGVVDQQTKDPSRFWYLPSCSEHFAFCRLAGEPLDVDAWLRKPDPAAYVPPPATRSRVDELEQAERRAVAYIAKMPEAISGAGGHNATWSVALVLAKGFGLSEERTFRILWHDYNPRCQPPWSEKELRHKAKQAQKARVPDGFKLDDGRDWEPRRWKLPEPPPDDDPDYIPEPPEEMFGQAPFEPEAPTREPGDDSEEIAAEPKAQKSAVETYGVVSLQQMFLELWKNAQQEKKHGYTTGNHELDAMLGGLRENHVTILGAGTSWGKSTMGIMVADENDQRGVPLLIISAEDAREMYGKRVLARRAKMNALRLRDYDLDRREVDEIAKYAGTASTRPIFLDAIGKPVEVICKAIRELSKELGIKLVIADYVQRFRANRSLERRNHVTYVAESLSDAIKQAGAAGLILSQLKRIEGREPTMDDLKESGDLENMVEHVLLGHREKIGSRYDDDQQFKRLVLVPKNKDGPLPSQPIEIPFDEVSASFKATTGRVWKTERDRKTAAAADEFGSDFQDGL